MLPRVRHVPHVLRRVHASDTTFIDSSDSESGEPSAKIPCCIARRASHIAACLLGLCPREYRHLKRKLVPRDFLQVLCAHHIEEGWQDQFIQLVDWFCGLGEIEKAGIRRDLICKGFEIFRDTELMNILLDAGFFTALTFAKQMLPLALSHWGTVCSSWIWAVRGITKRSLYRPMGDPSVSQTHFGNQMVMAVNPYDS